MSAADATANGVVAQCFAVSSLLNSQLGPKTHPASLCETHTHKLKCEDSQTFCVSAWRQTGNEKAGGLTKAHPCCCCRWLYLRVRGWHPGREGEKQHSLFCCWCDSTTLPAPAPNSLQPTPVVASSVATRQNILLSVSCAAVRSCGGAAGQLFACQGLRTLPGLEARPWRVAFFRQMAPEEGGFLA